MVPSLLVGGCCVLVVAACACASTLGAGLRGSAGLYPPNPTLCCLLPVLPSFQAFASPHGGRGGAAATVTLPPLAGMRSAALLLLLLLCALWGVPSFVFPACATALPSPPRSIRIGAVLPLSGPPAPAPAPAQPHQGTAPRHRKPMADGQHARTHTLCMRVV